MNSPDKHDLLGSGLQQKLARLREMLQLEQDLAEIMGYFHTVLVPDDDFIMAGTRSRQPRLEQVIHGVLNALAPGSKAFTPLIVRLATTRMSHGYAHWQRGHAVFFYFEELDMGLCSFARSLLEPEVTFARFKLVGPIGGSSWKSGPCGSA